MSRDGPRAARPGTTHARGRAALEAAPRLSFSRPAWPGRERPTTETRPAATLPSWAGGGPSGRRLEMNRGWAAGATLQRGPAPPSSNARRCRRNVRRRPDCVVRRARKKRASGGGGRSDGRAEAFRPWMLRRRIGRYLECKQARSQHSVPRALDCASPLGLGSARPSATYVGRKLEVACFHQSSPDSVLPNLRPCISPAAAQKRLPSLPVPARHESVTSKPGLEEALVSHEAGVR